MTARPNTPANSPHTYAELRRGVEGVVFAGRAKIEQAWLRTYHDTGRLIHEHLLLNQDRADYGAKVFVRLADDTGISKRVLYECVQLYRYFPIVRSTAQLTRSHYQLLCQVSDQKERNALMSQTMKQEWTVAELTTRVRTFNAASSGQQNDGNDAASDSATDGVELLTAKRGTPGLHLITARGDGLVVDLGFKLYRPLSAEQARRYAKGDIVRLDDNGSVRRDDSATKADLFTYPATIRRVVDGDTLIVAIHVTPEVVLEEKLRLRDLDCPELATPEGKAAKRFVDALLAPGAAVILTTTKPDKYDRYLADVFVPGETGQLKVEGLELRDPTFLNNALLENGHATRKDAWEFSDWDKDLMA
jgi:endonuclease YncB( thermonuclease family)